MKDQKDIQCSYLPSELIILTATVLSLVPQPSGVNKRAACFVAFFPDNTENNLNYSVIFVHTDKSNTTFESVKGLLLIVYTLNNNKMPCFCKIKKINTFE